MHAKVVFRCVEEFRNAKTSRKFAEAALTRYKLDGTGLRYILSLVKQRAFVPDLSTESASNVPEGIDDEEENWYLRGMIDAEDVDTPGIHGK